MNIIEANEPLDDDFMDERANAPRPAMSLSPSPSPIPPLDDIDPEIDPDNVVVRGSYTDDDDADDNVNDGGNSDLADQNRNHNIVDATKSNALQLDDFTSKSHSWVYVFLILDQVNS